MDTKGITITRRNLPHWHKDNAVQFVTFHLADSLPASVRRELNDIKARFMESNPEPWTDEVRKQFNSLFPSTINDYPDAGYGSCCLRQSECAEIMADALLFFDGVRYKLHRYVVMPNHVHVLVELLESNKLSDVCKSWKNFTAVHINRLLGKSGRFWHHESWDRLIRNEHHYDNVVKYIEKNISEGAVIWG